MISRFPSIVLSLGFAAALVTGCAGNRSSSSSSSGADTSALKQADEKNQKLDDARRSAEDAEQKAHQLREEKARNQPKTSSSN